MGRRWAGAMEVKNDMGRSDGNGAVGKKRAASAMLTALLNSWISCVFLTLFFVFEVANC